MNPVPQTPLHQIASLFLRAKFLESRRFSEIALAILAFAKSSSSGEDGTIYQIPLSLLTLEFSLRTIVLILLETSLTRQAGALGRIMEAVFAADEVHCM